MEKEIESLKDILANYDPIEEFRRKHEKDSPEEFEEWLNK